MNKIVDYITVFVEFTYGLPGVAEAEALDTLVKDKLKDGYVPFGGPSISSEYGIIQAMVKYDQQDNQ